MSDIEFKRVKLNGKVALITGANSGIGRVTAEELALQGYHVFLACRNHAKAEAVLQSIRFRSGNSALAEFLPLDLGDLASVKQCAEQFLKKGLALDLLINNAGLAGTKGVTDSGFEIMFGVCHVGHFLLNKLLMPALDKADSARVVVVSSKAHRHLKKFDFGSVRHGTQSIGGMREYAQAKLANILYVKALSKRFRGSNKSVYAVHPGIVATEVWRGLPTFLQPLLKRFMITAEQGARTTFYCATAPLDELSHGGYYDRCKQIDPSQLANNSLLAERLWTESEHWVARFA